MGEFFKKNKVTLIIVFATIILAGIAIFTAIRLYQLRQQAVAPNAPSSKPAAANVVTPQNQEFYFGNPTGDEMLVGASQAGNKTTFPVAYRKSSSTWFVGTSFSTTDNPVSFVFGIPGDQPLFCDWNGDGIATPGVYRNGRWLLRNSNSTGNADVSFDFGSAGKTYMPICGDWNGTGKKEPGLYDPATNTFYLRNSQTSGAADETFIYGIPNDIPVVGDWNANGQDRVGVYRNGQFFVRNTLDTGGADRVINFGIPGAFPIVGNWDGTGSVQVGVVVGNYWILSSANCQMSFTIGIQPTATPGVISCFQSCKLGDICGTGLVCQSIFGTNGFRCVNPNCASDSTCTCATATPTATPTVPGATATPTIPGATLTPTPTGTPTVPGATATPTIPGATLTPTPTGTNIAFATPTPTTPPQCNTSCTTNADCPSGMSCSAGVCRNTACVSSVNCICTTSAPISTPTSPAIAVGPTATPMLPKSGTIAPTILGIGIGAILLIAGLALIL